MKIALVVTVKNEERILKQNLRYHNAIGVHKAFVYFDNTTDNTKNSISDLEFVQTSNSISGNKYSDREQLQKLNATANSHHTARQCLNTYDAIQQCKQQNIDWLISLDADELVFIEKNRPSDLTQYFASVDSTIDLVNFLPYEILQLKSTYTNVFAEATIFKATHKFNRRIDRIYKSFFNPFNNENFKFSYWYGQHLGKSAIRIISQKEIIPVNVHRYSYLDGSLINSVDENGILHYHMYDAKDFIKKFKNFKDRPDTFLSGNRVESLKLFCRDIVNSEQYSKEELIQYFSKYVMFSSQEYHRLLRNRSRLYLKRKQPAVIEITSVKNAFNTLLNNIEKE